MRDEKHRDWSISAFIEYANGSLDKIDSIRLSELPYGGLIEPRPWDRIVYFLRLDPMRHLDPTVLAIPNRNDEKRILYIGGHTKIYSGTRYNVLIESCRKSQNKFEADGYAKNDQKHNHPVASCLTTSLLKTGFRIQDCVLDIVSGAPKYDELDFIIGYEEKYHHLPPWNSNRKGNQAYPPDQA